MAAQQVGVAKFESIVEFYNQVLHLNDQCHGNPIMDFFFLPAAKPRRSMDHDCSPSAIIGCIYQNGSRGH